MSALTKKQQDIEKQFDFEKILGKHNKEFIKKIWQFVVGSITDILEKFKI